MNSKFNWIAFWLCLSTILSCSILIASAPSNSEIPKVNHREASMEELKIVKNREDLAALSGKKVKLVGYYTSQSSKPQVTGNPGFRGVYIKSQIVLEDGTVIHIFPSWNKQSLRSPSEVENHQGKIVTAIGIVEYTAISRINSQTRESFINLEELTNN
ncbi:hypothetical protein [Calothrix sp. UHCC 0171]|uniref:hypothetical protein n=1 Tax=Calothrix sp. UHCC 0171 TaxID=3110245 RepID=UPI002B215C20|nr:hypothetical protein [Calothrix sp. UHCC 0171]MEA5572837.1 hypothetical protein [Calothrix sp. UHCC 0171]